MSNRETIKHATYNFFKEFVEKYEKYEGDGPGSEEHAEQIAGLKGILQELEDSLYLTIKETIEDNESYGRFTLRLTNEQDGYFRATESNGREPTEDLLLGFREYGFRHFSKKYNVREADITLVTSSGVSIPGPTLSLEDRNEAEEFHRPEDEEPA